MLFSSRKQGRCVFKHPEGRDASRVPYVTGVTESHSVEGPLPTHVVSASAPSVGHHPCLWSARTRPGRAGLQGTPAPGPAQQRAVLAHAACPSGGGLPRSPQRGRGHGDVFVGSWCVCPEAASRGTPFRQEQGRHTPPCGSAFWSSRPSGSGAPGLCTHSTQFANRTEPLNSSQRVLEPLGALGRGRSRPKWSDAHGEGDAVHFHQPDGARPHSWARSESGRPTK